MATPRPVTFRSAEGGGPGDTLAPAMGRAHMLPPVLAHGDTQARSALVLAGALIGLATWLVLGAVSPGYTVFGVHIAPYSPIAQPISGLGLGVTAPYMNAAFVLSGLAMFTGVVGICAALPSRPALCWLCEACLRSRHWA